VPLLTVIVAVGLGPYDCVAVPFYVSPRIPGQKGPPYYTDVVIKKVPPSYISVHRSSDNRSIGTVIMVIEIKKVVPMLVKCQWQRHDGTTGIHVLHNERQMTEATVWGHYGCESVARIVHVKTH